MVLPGKIAKETRTQLADIIRRYMAGDETLVVQARPTRLPTRPWRGWPGRR
jgi:hypothetical protein